MLSMVLAALTKKIRRMLSLRKLAYANFLRPFLGRNFECRIGTASQNALHFAACPLLSEGAASCGTPPAAVALKRGQDTDAKASVALRAVR